jgi:hypothetical protein
MSKPLSGLNRLLNYAGRTGLPESDVVNDLSTLGVRAYAFSGQVVATKEDGVTIRFRCEGNDFEGFAPFGAFENKALATESLDRVSLVFRVQNNAESGVYLQVYDKARHHNSDNGDGFFFVAAFL